MSPSRASRAADLTADVVVVGAGLAGLAAARDLVAAAREVVVLEARERVGGRVLSTALEGGGVAELGAQWIGPGQDRIAAAAADVGVGTFPTDAAGRNLVRLDGRSRTYAGTIPRLEIRALFDLEQLRRRLERLARRVSPDAPWTAPHAARLDAQTLGDWLASAALTDTSRTVLRIVSRTVWGAEPEELSLLHVLFYVRAAGGFDALVDVEGGAQQDRLEGGAGLVAERMAERLGERVVLGEPVRRIAHRPDGVVVEAERVAVHARRAIVAAPAPLAGRIAYQPPLPAARDGLTQRAPHGSIAKVAAVYDEPFWRSAGLSGEALSDEEPVTMTFDGSPADGRPGVLVGFVGGRAARDFAELSVDERRASALRSLVALFGPPAGQPRELHVQHWDEDPWARGGPVSHLPPGGWTDYGPALREPVGSIGWAGTETATRWAGYMDGAVRSGERAAREALIALDA